MEKRAIVEIQEHEDGSAFIEFPEDMMQGLDWKEGDTVVWKDNKDGSYTLTKKEVEETQWVLVEAVCMHRTRYMVQVPVGIDNYGRDKKDWALDTVVSDEAVEFSSQFIDESIVSYRNVSFDEALAMCKNDNSYCSGWDEGKIVSTFFTKMKEE